MPPAKLTNKTSRNYSKYCNEKSWLIEAPKRNWMTIGGNHLKLSSLKGGWADNGQAMANDNKKTGTLQPTMWLDPWTIHFSRGEHIPGDSTGLTSQQYSYHLQCHLLVCSCLQDHQSEWHLCIGEACLLPLCWDFPESLSFESFDK